MMPAIKENIYYNFSSKISNINHVNTKWYKEILIGLIKTPLIFFNTLPFFDNVFSFWKTKLIIYDFYF